MLIFAGSLRVCLAVEPVDRPVKEETILPVAVQEEPEKWRRIAQEVTERLEMEPGKLFLKRTIRPVSSPLKRTIRPVSSPRPPTPPCVPKARRSSPSPDPRYHHAERRKTRRPGHAGASNA